MRLSDLLELLGFACFVAFAFLLFPPAALAVAGVELVFLGYALSNEGDIHFGTQVAKATAWVKARRKAREAAES